MPQAQYPSPKSEPKKPAPPMRDWPSPLELGPGEAIDQGPYIEGPASTPRLLRKPYSGTPPQERAPRDPDTQGPGYLPQQHDVQLDKPRTDLPHPKADPAAPRSPYKSMSALRAPLVNAALGMVGGIASPGGSPWLVSQLKQAVSQMRHTSPQEFVMRLYDLLRKLPPEARGADGNATLQAIERVIGKWGVPPSAAEFLETEASQSTVPWQVVDAYADASRNPVSPAMQDVPLYRHAAGEAGPPPSPIDRTLIDMLTAPTKLGSRN